DTPGECGDLSPGAGGGVGGALREPGAGGGAAAASLHHPGTGAAPRRGAAAPTPRGESVCGTARGAGTLARPLGGRAGRRGPGGQPGGAAGDRQDAAAHRIWAWSIARSGDLV